MAPREAERLRIASTLHDVGKIGVADRVLLKRGELDSAEWDAMMAHTTAGAALLSGSRSPLLQMAEVIARTHHERWDGTGYPEGLKGDQIPLVGRICAICDVFDALASRRSYKDPWAFDRVVREIERKRGSHFDPRVVDAFLKVIDEFRDEAWDLRRRRAPDAAESTAAAVPAGVDDGRGAGAARRARRRAGRGPRRSRDRGSGDGTPPAADGSRARGGCPARTARRRGRARRAASRRPRAAASTSRPAASRTCPPGCSTHTGSVISRKPNSPYSAHQVRLAEQHRPLGRELAGELEQVARRAAARDPRPRALARTTSPPSPTTSKGGWAAGVQLGEHRPAGRQQQSVVVAQADVAGLVAPGELFAGRRPRVPARPRAAPPSRARPADRAPPASSPGHSRRSPPGAPGAGAVPHTLCAPCRHSRSSASGPASSPTSNACRCCWAGTSS